MGFDIGRAGLAVATGGGSEAARLLMKKGGARGGAGEGVDIDPAVKARLDALGADLDKMPNAEKLKHEGFRERSKAPLPQFNAMRARTENRARANEQQNMGALQRRFAAMGGMNSGAAIKQQQIAQQASQQAREDAMQGVDIAEAQETRRISEFDDSLDDQIKGRNLSRDMANIDNEFRDKVFKFDSKSKLAQLDMQARGIQQQLTADKFNKEMALYQQKHSGGLLGAGGMLGTGLGADMGGSTGFGV